MKFASSCFLLIVGTVVGSTDAFLPTSQIAVRQQIINDDAFALYMKQSKNRHAEYQNGQPDVRLHQSSTSYDASATCAQSVLLIPTATTSTAASSSNPLAKALLQQPSLLVKALASSTLFIFSDILIKQIFKAKGIGFPSSLAGCCAMAATLLVNPFHASMYQVLAPGAKLLQKFLMVFLVPNLIVLPMCDGCGSVTDMAKIFSVIFGGFLFSLLSTAYSVCAVRKFFGSPCPDNAAAPVAPTQVAATPAEAATATTITKTPPKAFSDELTLGSRNLAVASGVAAILAHHLNSATTTPLVALSMLAATFHNFCFGARLPKKLTKTVLHPLVTCTTLTWVWASILGAATGTPFLSMIEGYRLGGGLNMATSGAGDLLTFVLGPAVVSLGVSIYERRQLIRQNLKEVVTATGVSCVGGLFGTALAVRLLALATGDLRLSLLPRNITSALAAAIAEIVGASKPLAVSFAVVTGLIGANFGASLLDYFGVKDPAARGLGIGSAAHGLGTAAFIDEKDAFPFAAIGMTLTAICGTVLVSVPFVKQLALKIALGGL